MSDDYNHLETLLVSDFIAGEKSLSPPIIYSATFQAEDEQEFRDMATTCRHPQFYTRYGNPVHARAADMIARLEGMEAALVTASGMSAISTTLLSLLSAGDHIVAQTNHYMGTSKILTDLLPRFGVEVTLVEQNDLSAFAAALGDNTKVIYLETPANPTLSLTDLRAVTQLAKTRGILSVCDNTFASPVNQQPGKWGVDIVVHSATKFLGGHHDITAGAIVSSRAKIEKIWKTLVTLGPTLSPMDGWLLLRGMRTLALRVQRQNQTALTIAHFLEKHPKIEKVYYPGLPSHPQHALALEQMSGFGGVLSFTLKGDFTQTSQFMAKLKIPRKAVSLGGVETLIVHAAAMWSGTMDERALKKAGIPLTLVRLALGLEHEQDLQADLAQALE